MKPAIENSITNIFTQFDSNVTIPCTLRHGFPAPAIYWFAFSTLKIIKIFEFRSFFLGIKNDSNYKFMML